MLDKSSYGALMAQDRQSENVFLASLSLAKFKTTTYI